MRYYQHLRATAFRNTKETEGIMHSEIDNDATGVSTITEAEERAGDISFAPETWPLTTAPCVTAPNAAAEELRRRIYNELEGTSAQCFALDQSWTRVGVLLVQFKACEGWRPLGYGCFDDFMEELKVKFKRGRTQLWGYLGVAETLLPTIGAAKLEQMGISKALELKRAMKKLEGKPLPQALIDAALDSAKTTKELRGDIGVALNLTEEPSGTWFDLDGFFMTKEEREEFKEAIKATVTLLGLKKDLPEHIRRKEIIMSWMREWYGTHAAEVNGPQVENTLPVLTSPFVSSIPRNID